MTYACAPKSLQTAQTPFFGILRETKSKEKQGLPEHHTKKARTTRTPHKKPRTTTHTTQKFKDDNTQNVWFCFSAILGRTRLVNFAEKGNTPLAHSLTCRTAPIFCFHFLRSRPKVTSATSECSLSPLRDVSAVDFRNQRVRPFDFYRFSTAAENQSRLIVLHYFKPCVLANTLGTFKQRVILDSLSTI